MIRLILMLCLIAAPAAAHWTVLDDDARKQHVGSDLDANNAHLTEALQHEKFDAMDDSAFTFLRGAAHLYHRDLLESGALEKSAFRLPDTITWLQGDAHVRNVGVFVDDRGEVVFDFDDFDQAWPGSYLVDVWRMASSLHLFADEAGFEDAGDRAARAFAESYLETVKRFAGNDKEKNFQLDKGEATGPARRLISETLDEEGRKVMTKEWTRGKKDHRRFRQLDDLERLEPTQEKLLRDAVKAWSAELEGFGEDYFRILDVARRLKAGIGSRGVDRFYVLIEGPKKKKRDVILDIKAQVAEPSLARLFELPSPASGPLPTAGCRVVLAERAMLAEADNHLGCLDLQGPDGSVQSFSIRQRNPYKKGMKAKKIDGAGDLEKLATELGRVMAAAHSRADEDFKPGGVTGSFDDAFARAVASDEQQKAFIDEVSTFASQYAQQITIDYDIFVDWLEAR